MKDGLIAVFLRRPLQPFIQLCCHHLTYQWLKTCATGWSKWGCTEAEGSQSCCWYTENIPWLCLPQLVHESTLGKQEGNRGQTASTGRQSKVNDLK